MRRKALIVAASLMCVAATPAAAGDNEWPPREAYRTTPVSSAGSRAAAQRPNAAVRGSSAVSPAAPLFGPGSLSGQDDDQRQSAPQRAPRPGDPRRNTKPEAKKEGEKRRPQLPPSTGPWRWKVTKAAWDAEDETGYEAFIRKIGESECANVHDCLTSPVANPRFHDRHPPRMTFFADCADLPFALRAYYAWMNGLPFSFPLRLAHHPRTPGHQSGLLGHQTIERYDIVGPGPDPRLALPVINAYVSSEHFRTPPAYAGKEPNDHYPVKITRESIRPGTVMFDPDGHLAIVYDVTEDGRVLYIDSHPDNTLTRGTFNREFDRAEPPMGAGFKRWRPQRLVGARLGKDGTLVGGRIVLAADRDLADWSDEQFFGNTSPRPTRWSDGRFEIDGQEMEFHEYVRLRLARPGFRYDPLAEVRSMVRQLCRDMRYRVDAVDLAVRAGIDRRPQPDRLPRNIYATSGDWETYSTPSRDARLKTAFEELHDEIERFLGLERSGSGIVAYDGNSLAVDLLLLYRAETSRCSITYRKSDGSPMTLGFEEVKRRLFALSFDPYHCVERRWGADDPAELATCAEDQTKRAWYVAQARLRHQLVRTYGEQMGWSLAELENREADIGIAQAPDIDPLKALLAIGSPEPQSEAAGGADGTASSGARKIISIAGKGCPPGSGRRRNRSVRHCAN